MQVTAGTSSYSENGLAEYATNAKAGSASAVYMPFYVYRVQRSRNQNPIMQTLCSASRILSGARNTLQKMLSPCDHISEMNMSCFSAAA